jgi:hypothetical protein
MNYVELYIVKLGHVQYYSPFYVKANLQLKRVADVHVIGPRILETPRIRTVYQLNKALGRPHSRYRRYRRKWRSPGGNRNFLFSKNIQTGPGTHTNSSPMGIGVLLRARSGLWEFTTQLPLVARLRTIEATYTCTSHMPPRRRHGKLYLFTFIPDDDPKVLETYTVSKILIKVFCVWMERPLVQSVDMNTST